MLSLGVVDINLYFINCRLVIALNMCLALNGTERITNKRILMISSRGGDTEEELTSLPCLETGIKQRSQNSQTVDKSELN